MKNYTLDEFDKPEVVPNKHLHKVEPHDLSKVARTPSGNMVELRNVGRLIIPTDHLGKITPDVIEDGWMLGTARHISTYYNCAAPHHENKTFVLHERNRDTKDPLNESEVVMLPEKLLTFIYKYGGDKDKDFEMMVPKYQDYLNNFMEHVLIRNGFIPENCTEKDKLHRLLQNNPLRIVVAPDKKELEQFRAVASPFANIRMEDLEPHKKMEDAFDDDILYAK